MSFDKVRVAKEAYQNSIKEQYDSPHWQKKRLEVFESRDWRCEHCQEKENKLNAHHKRYINGRKVWEYESSEFLCLCGFCHSKEHDRINKEKEMIEAGIGGEYLEIMVKELVTDELKNFNQEITMKSFGEFVHVCYSKFHRNRLMREYGHSLFLVGLILEVFELSIIKKETIDLLGQLQDSIIKKG